MMYVGSTLMYSTVSVNCTLQILMDWTKLTLSKVLLHPCTFQHHGGHDSLHNKFFSGLGRCELSDRQLLTNYVQHKYGNFVTIVPLLEVEMRRPNI